MEGLTAALFEGVKTTLGFFWDSLFGLIFGFLISALVQVVVTPRAMERWLGPNVRGVLSGAAFGIISSACSYGAAAAARGFFQRGADVRSIFSFLISSTNMNVAIVILFWTLLGWKFAFAEFFGGVIIIAVVVTGLSLLFTAEDFRRMREDSAAAFAAHPRSVVTECPICGMEGEAEHAVAMDGVTYLACGQNHANALRAAAPGPKRLSDPAAWSAVWQTMLGDIGMLRTELVIGYVIAGFASALVPRAWLSGVLAAVGHVPYIGYVLVLACGLLIAIATFVCSMGNVPVARFLAMAGIPLGANTTFIYGDLLVPPLIAIYRKSFPSRVVWAFVALFAIGAMLAGAVMEFAIGRGLGGVSMMGSMLLNDRFTIASNTLAILALAAVYAVAKSAERRSNAPSAS